MQAKEKPLLSPEAIVYYWDHAYDFVLDNIIVPARRVMPGATITSQQKQFLDEISKYPKVSVESGHGTGKSASLSWGGIWFLSTRRNSLGVPVKIPCIAPTYHQLYDILWPEFKRWIALSRIKRLFEVKEEEIYVHGHKDDLFIRARSPKEPENIQGFHAKHLLWLCDEAFCIQDDEVWETIEGSLTQGDDNKIIVAGQHKVLIGFVHETFHRDKAAWRNLRFNSEKSPLADKEYCKRIALRYGKDSDVYRVRVLGTEPRGNPEALISYSDAEAARQRDVKPEGPIRMGVDPARFGDDLFCVATAQGNHIFPLHTVGKTDTNIMNDHVLFELRKYRKLTGYRGIVVIRIDNSGGHGAGLVDMLKRNTTDNIQVEPIEFGGEGDKEYFNAISKMWGEFKGMLPNLQLPDDDDLILQLSSRRYKFDQHGRLRIEPKDEYKKEYGESPDRADAVLLCMSNKQAVRYVLPSFSALNVEELNIYWSNVGPRTSAHYGALVLTRDMKVFFMAALWDAMFERLYVYAARQWESPAPKQMVAQVVIDMRMHEYKCNRLIGNDRFFTHAKGMRDPAYYFNRMMKEWYYGPIPRERPVEMAKLKEAIHFDQFGAISIIDQMCAAKTLYVEKRYGDAVDMIQNWTIDNGRPSEHNAGYCECLCLILSEVKRHIRETNKGRKLMDYHRAGRKGVDDDGRADFQRAAQETWALKGYAERPRV